MGASSGPQPGAGHHSALPTAADPRPDPPSALGGPPAAAHDATTPLLSASPHLQPQSSSQQSSSPLEGVDTAGTAGIAAETEAEAEAEDDDPEAYESRHVHTVYEAIAPHFSSTRYKPWPLVSSFLLSLPPGSVGLDAGCGNGKYLAVNPSLFVLASDRSANLVSLARSYRPPPLDEGAPKQQKQKKKGKKSPVDTSAAVITAASSSPPSPPSENPPPPPPKNQVLVADSLALPYRPAAFDFAISIAVVHHLSTRPRRRAAVAALLSAVRPVAGRVLVYVWALEQGGSRRGWDEGADQDQLVPWVTKGKKVQQPQPQQQQQQGQEQQQQQQEQQQEEQQPQEQEQQAQQNHEQQPRDATYQRYYHLYRQGELEEDVVAVGGRVLESGYEKDNWWAICCRDS